MLFSGLQLKGLICLSTKKKKKKLCGGGGGGHVFEFSAFFLWVRSPHGRKKRTLTSVIQTRLVEPKIKPTLMKAGVLRDIILDLILRL